MLLKYILISVITAYVIGSIPSAVWMGWVLDQDVRESGSKNPGATNVYRVLGIVPALVVFLIDFGKGALAIWVCWKWNLPSLWLIVAALCVMLGHIFPVLAGFSGGKGVSTAAGVLLLVDPLVLSLSLIVFALILFRFRLVSVASISSGTVAFLAALVQKLFLSGHWSAVGITGLFLIIILITHHDNILRLKTGHELRI